ncbi:MarR family winged helix-turn-helix transcriptional regulator [Marinomonas sp. 5E14-1]|uniref:MarR family winged helix-turn-helix transcriptional regulator n=1 Tax=Marinomonas sp. 5E14-1 TaxID=3153922 RepID=UPI003263C37E
MEGTQWKNDKTKKANTLPCVTVDFINSKTYIDNHSHLKEIQMKENISEILHHLIHEYKIKTKNLILNSGISIPISHIRLLKFINNTEHCTASSITRTLSLDKSQVARSLKDLEREGYITKHRHPDNHRSQLLELTENGAILIRDLIQLNQKTTEKMTNELTEQEIKDFIHIAEIMTRNLSSHNLY